MSINAKRNNDSLKCIIVKLYIMQNIKAFFAVVNTKQIIKLCNLLQTSIIDTTIGLDKMEFLNISQFQNKI